MEVVIAAGPGRARFRSHVDDGLLVLTVDEAGLPGAGAAIAPAAAVRAALVEAGLSSAAPWAVDNLVAGLGWLGREVLAWQGVEWAVDDHPPRWADPATARAQFEPFWAVTATGRCGVGTYQDDADFGLRLVDVVTRTDLGAEPDGILRRHDDLPLPCGGIRRVDLVVDVELDLVVQMRLVTDEGPLVLLAAECHGDDVWCLHDESVVTVPPGLDPALCTWVGGGRWWHPRP